MSTISAESSITGPLPTICADDLRAERPVRELPGRNRTKADILVYRHRGHHLAVKDYARCSWPIRVTLGRFLIRREASVYRAAAGLPGLPRFAGRLGPYALATEWIEGRTLSQHADGVVDPKKFDALRAILEGLHHRGVALADFHHRDVLIGNDQEVYLIDLAMAWVLRDGAGRISRRIFHRFRNADLWALARLRARFCGDDSASAIPEVGQSTVNWHRRARRIKWYWDRLRGAPRIPPAE